MTRLSQRRLAGNVPWLHDLSVRNPCVQHAVHASVRAVQAEAQGRLWLHERRRGPVLFIRWSGRYVLLCDNQSPVAFEVKNAG